MQIEHKDGPAVGFFHTPVYVLVLQYNPSFSFALYFGTGLELFTPDDSARKLAMAYNASYLWKLKDLGGIVHVAG